MKKNMNDKRLAFAVSITLLLVIFFPLVNSQINHRTPPLPLDNLNWWNISWPYRKLIAINHTKVGSSLINFPVLVYRSSDSDLANKAQTKGQDIVFVLYSDNTTKLNHEIESYSNTNGSLVAWVNVTAVSSTADTKIWMYYGNNACSNQQNMEGTWDSHYVYVQHLNETSGPVYDSTQYSNDGTSYGAMNRTAPGKMGGGYYFDRLNDYVDTTNSSSLYNAVKNAFTVEAWSETNKPNNWRSVITKDRGGTGKTSEFWFGYGTNNKLDFKFNAGTDRYGNTSITDTNWHYIVGRFDGTYMRLFLDGAPDNAPVSVAKVNPSNGSVNLGFTKYWGDNYYGGTLDEVRISDVARNSSWLSTSYKNQNNPTSFISIGIEEPYQYSLTIAIDGQGTVTKDPDQTTYTYGTVVQLTAIPDTGWSFDYWSGDLTGSTNPASITMTGNKAVTIHFTQNIYTLTITVDPIGAGTVDATPAPPYHYNDIVTLTATANPGYTFDHWSGNLTGNTNPADITIDEDKAVTAHFTQDHYTLTITIDGQGTVTKDPDQTTYTYGTVVQLTAIPDTGWSFDHWSGDLTGSTNPFDITMDGDKAVTAYFTQNVYTLTITVDPIAGGAVSTSPAPPYHYNDVVTLTAITNPGYTFDHWSGDASGSSTVTTVTMDGDKSVTAHFTQNVYTLTISVDPAAGGSVAADPGPPYHYGDVVTLTASANAGYTFDHWSGDASGSSTVTTVMMNEDKSVTAHFTQSDYTLTITVDPATGGSVTADPGPPYHYNDVVTLTAMANTGYTFDYWSGDLTGSDNPTTITIDGDKTVTAHFTLASGYTLTITIDGSGIVTKNPDQPSYTYGQVVTLTATASTGWLFDHWGGDLNGNQNPITITMDEDKSVIANFTAIHYILTITIQGSGFVTKNPSKPWYIYGEVIVLTAVPNSHWVFNQWRGDLTGSTNPASITMNGNKMVIANFTFLNHPPLTPERPNGETSGKVGKLYWYTAVTTDEDDDQIYYQFNWSDGTASEWIGPCNSGAIVNASHTWMKKGNYNIQVRAKDSYGAITKLSDPLPITMPYTIIRPIQQFLEQLFEWFPHLFPILRYLLGC